jgi:hypothetical protein
MGLRHGDLKDTILDKISIDEFEPKTGKVEDVLVVGLYVTDDNVGQDLYDFLDNTFDYINDIEISPNTNEDDYYMVFIEMARDEHAPKYIKKIIKDITNLSGNLGWQAKTHLTDKYYDLDDEDLWQYLITDPDKYMTRKEFDEYQAQQQLAKESEELKVQEAQTQSSNSAAILEFLKDSNLLQAGINQGKLHMQDSRNVMTLEVLDFGPAEEVMSRQGIHEAAIDSDFDHTVFRKLRGMLGDISVMPIGQCVVIHNPNKPENVLITKTI